MVGADGQITAIKAHPKRRKHYSVFVNDDEVLTVHEDVVVALGLRVGAPVNQDLLERAAREQDIANARLSALRLLGVRSRSRRKLQEALERKGSAADVVEETLVELENLGLVNDEQFARDLAQSLLRRQGYGRQRLLYRLRESGVTREVAAEAVAETLQGVDETQRALAALERRLPRWEALPPSKRRAKAYQHLIRLGFDGDVVSDALGSALADD